MHGYRVPWLEFSGYLGLPRPHFDILGQIAGFREWIRLMIGGLVLCFVLNAY